MARAAPWLVSAALLVALWWPLVAKRDSFPLSTYPMFSRERAAEIDVDHVIGVLADGGREPVPPSLVADGEVLQTRVLVRGAVQRGRDATRELCRAVAERAGTRYLELEVRSDRYQVLGYFAGNREPVTSRVHARCRPPEGGAR